MAAARSSVMGCGGESTFAKSLDIWDCLCKCDGVGIIIKIQFSLGHRPRQLSLRHYIMRNIPAICQHITGDTAHTLPHFVNIIKCITALHCCCSYIFIVKLKVRVWGQMTRPGTEYEGL